MKAIILCAGYATRMYPLTENFPKPLLPIKRGVDFTILDSIIKNIEIYNQNETSDFRRIDEAFIVSNARYFLEFNKWAMKRSPEFKFRVMVVNDRTTIESNKLGAVGDIQYVLNSFDFSDEEEFLILAGDSIFSSDLISNLSYTFYDNGSAVLCDRISDLDLMRRCGNITVNGEGFATNFKEKPTNPDPLNDMICYAMYMMTHETLSELGDYFLSPNYQENLGGFLEYLINQKKFEIAVSNFNLNSYFLDIGTIEAYESYLDSQEDN